MADCVYHKVANSSVGQYISTDKNGADVYEGDQIAILGHIDDEGEFWIWKEPAVVTATMHNLEDVESGLAVVKVNN